MKWISVKDDLPETNEPLMGYNDNDVREVFIENYHVTVLGFIEETGIGKFNLDRYGHWSEISSISSRGIDPTHWMPLPEPPKR